VLPVLACSCTYSSAAAAAAALILLVACWWRGCCCCVCEEVRALAPVTPRGWCMLLCNHSHVRVWSLRMRLVTVCCSAA